MLSRRLTSIKPSAKLRCGCSHGRDICEHDTPAEQTGIQRGRAPCPQRGNHTNTHFLITICFIANDFNSSFSLYPPQTQMIIPPPKKIKLTFLSNEMSGFASFEITPLPRGSRIIAPLYRRRFTFKVSFPWLNSPFTSPSVQFYPAAGHVAPTYPEGGEPGLGHGRSPSSNSK